MITPRLSGDRGRTRLPWLDSYHTFSFGDYRDAAHTHFSHLRVLNDDTVAPGGGFDTHPHRDMEIITIPLAGSLRHKDSLGTTSTISPGEVQRMTAGRGILHSEHNASSTEPVHLLQLWIFPNEKGLEPSYQQRAFALADRPDRLHTLVSPDERDGSILIHQDASIHAASLNAGSTVPLEVKPGRSVWLHVTRGVVTVNDGVRLAAGDAAGVREEERVVLRAGDAGAQFIVIDLA